MKGWSQSLKAETTAMKTDTQVNIWRLLGFSFNNIALEIANIQVQYTFNQN